MTGLLAALDRVLDSPDAEPLCLASPEDRQRLRELVAALGAKPPADRKPCAAWVDAPGVSRLACGLVWCEVFEVLEGWMWEVRSKSTIFDWDRNWCGPRDEAKLRAEHAARVIATAMLDVVGGPL